MLRALLLTVAILFLFAGSAAAESAWVLWQTSYDLTTLTKIEPAVQCVHQLRRV